MKTIGIMSMHRIFNYGSFLQGYALKQMLLSLAPTANVSFLDYRPGRPIIAAPEEDNRPLARAAKKLAEYGKVKTSLSNKIRFFDHKRTYAQKNFPILGVPKEPNYDFNVDLQVIGSDEVFNCIQANTNVGYSPDLFGWQSPAKRLVSYAGSFGNTTFDKILSFGLDGALAQYFSNFDDISVRDENSADIIERLVGRAPSINVDPVLAYDYMSLCPQIPQERIIEGGYLIVYGYAGRFTPDENRLVRNYAKERKLKIVCLGGIQDCCDLFLDCSPFEVLALFRDADAIVTDTFHGTIFSIINNKSFLTVIRRSRGAGYGNEEKLHYLLRSMGLSSNGVFAIDSDTLARALGEKIDYRATVALLESSRQSAMSYLQRNVHLQ